MWQCGLSHFNTHHDFVMMTSSPISSGCLHHSKVLELTLFHKTPIVLCLVVLVLFMSLWLTFMLLFSP